MVEPGAEGVRRGRYERLAYAQKVAAVQAVCRRIEAGVSLAEACRRPDMPQRTTLIAWLARDPELRGMVAAAEAASAAVFGARREYHYWDPDVAAEVLTRVEDGRGLTEVCAERDVPAYSTVMRWINERPDYFDAYAGAGHPGGPPVRPGVADRAGGDGGDDEDGAAEDPDADVALRQAGAAALRDDQGAGAAGRGG
jgi:hypothetical protein